MASLAKTYSKEKIFGQIYTPSHVVCKILDEVGFNSSAVLGHKILDPACGDGRFLSEIVKRIIKWSPAECLVENLECVYGWDIDEDAVKQAKDFLNDLIHHLGIEVNWNILVVDSIKKLEVQSLFSNFLNEDRFDYIVGNPPYIRIQHLDIAQREYIKCNYTFCKSGSTDIYIAFFELCQYLLSSIGVCGLVTPNTFFYTETASAMRQHFYKRKNLKKISNYGDIQLFEDATTYSAITIFDNDCRESFIFEKALSVDSFDSIPILFDNLKEPFWQLSVELLDGQHGVKLGDVANIHVGITTLCDKVYIFEVGILDVEDIGEGYVVAKTRLAGHVKIERGILKPIVKGSTLKSAKQGISEWIIFPYKRVDGKHVIIPENELIVKYPLAYDYLYSQRSELDKRDNGKPNPVAWYAFGRSQGLDTSFGRKIIFSPMNKKPNFVYYENEDCTFYSGYCIKYQNNVKILLSQLNSERMRKFIEVSSRDYRGGWKAYNKKVVENYVVELQ